MTTSNINSTFSTRIPHVPGMALRFRDFLQERANTPNEWDDLLHLFLVQEVKRVITLRRGGILQKVDHERLAMIATTSLDSLIEILMDELTFQPLGTLRLNIGLTMK